jgi:3D (Asp-Asp-Asp) domain-containing protein
VEDRGGAIKGKRLDLFFDSHKEALEWGRQQLDVKVWRR